MIQMMSSPGERPSHGSSFDKSSSEQLRFRGGTALNKLHFPKPLRYSEDIDLTRTTKGPVGPALDRIRAVLEPWMGHGHYDLGLIGPKLTFTMDAEDKNSPVPIRVKVETATRERTAYLGAQKIPFAVKNPWFAGAADISTFSKEEILATKLRALLQRDKGRDLLDLAYATVEFEGLDCAKVVECFGKYLEGGKQSISRAEAEQRMFAKLDDPSFLADVRPLLAADEQKNSMMRLPMRRSAWSFRSSLSAFPENPGPKRTRWPTSSICRNWRKTSPLLPVAKAWRARVQQACHGRGCHGRGCPGGCHGVPE
jgi:predicted nucleotidyltransferase component of viral defense system